VSNFWGTRPLLEVEGLYNLYDTLKRLQWLVFSFTLLDVKLPKITHHWNSSLDEI